MGSLHDVIQATLQTAGFVLKEVQVQDNFLVSNFSGHVNIDTIKQQGVIAVSRYIPVVGDLIKLNNDK